MRRQGSGARAGAHYLQTARVRSVWTKLPFAALLLLVGCQAVGPDYTPPQSSTSLSRFPSASGEPADLPNSVWWSAGVEPTLTSLVNDAIAANYDLAEAIARVKASRALLRESESRRVPSLDLTADAPFNRQSVASFGFPGVQAEDRFSPTTSLSASWEIDLFGRIARQIEGAAADSEALQASRDDLARLIAADVALAYLDLREAQVREQVASNNLVNQRRTLEITQILAENGKASRLDVARSEAQVATTEARLPLLRSQEVSARNRLSTLLALEPGMLDDRLEVVSGLPELPAVVPAVSPAVLIQRRPDVRAAERNLAAATARTGVATADLYPTISLTGSSGFSAADAGDFGSDDSLSFSIGPRLSWNILDRGATYARIEQADANASADLARFRQTVLVALEEVDSALAAYNEEAVRLDRLKAARDASFEAQDLARARFELGREPFLTVLDAERSLLAADDDLALSAAARLRAQIQLYRALAGGWGPDAEPISMTALEPAR